MIVGASVAAATVLGTTKLAGAYSTPGDSDPRHFQPPNLTVTAPPESLDLRYSDQDPVTSGTYTRANGSVTPCANGGKTIATSNVSDKNGNVLGWVQLMWSPDCHTNWALVSVAKSLPPQHIQVEAVRSDGYHTSLDLIPGTWSGAWSSMVYAPNALAGAYAAFLTNGNPDSAVVASGQASQAGCKCPAVLSNGSQRQAPQPLALPDGAIHH